MKINCFKYIVLGVYLLASAGSYAGMHKDVEEFDNKKAHKAWSHSLSLEEVKGYLDSQFSNNKKGRDWASEYAGLVSHRKGSHKGYPGAEGLGNAFGVNYLGASMGPHDKKPSVNFGDFYYKDKFWQQASNGLIKEKHEYSGEHKHNRYCKHETPEDNGVSVAEPSSIVLLALGLVGLAFCRRKNLG